METLFVLRGLPMSAGYAHVASSTRANQVNRIPSRPCCCTLGIVKAMLAAKKAQKVNPGRNKNPCRQKSSYELRSLQETGR